MTWLNVSKILHFLFIPIPLYQLLSPPLGVSSRRMYEGMVKKSGIFLKWMENPWQGRPQTSINIILLGNISIDLMRRHYLLHTSLKTFFVSGFALLVSINWWVSRIPWPTSAQRLQPDCSRPDFRPCITSSKYVKCSKGANLVKNQTLLKIKKLIINVDYHLHWHIGNIRKISSVKSRL